MRKPQEKILSLLKKMQFFFRCALIPLPGIAGRGELTLDCLLRVATVIGLYASIGKHVLTHIACSFDSTLCSCYSS